jgi:rhodanese-related sulfurtransferase
METALKKMGLSFTGQGKHVINFDAFLEKQGAIFLDVRSKEECDTLRYNFDLFGIKVLEIPIEDLPDKLDELPKNKLIGTFCSSKIRAAWAYIYLISKEFEKVKWISASNEDIGASLKTRKNL